MPADNDNPARNGERLDGRDLTREWRKKYPRATYVSDLDSFNKIKPKQVDHLLGLFNSDHMDYETDRLASDNGEPSLAAMTDKAIDILAKNKQGYFLMVEAGRIDHAHHAGNAQRALQDTVALSDAVRTALEKTNPEDTLIIVTADHSHVFTIAGYPTRGNPILGKVIENDEYGDANQEPSRDFDDLPYTTVGYANGWGYHEHISPDERHTVAPAIGRQDLSAIDTEDPNFHQEALVTTIVETHAGEDVAIYASGPYAHLFRKTEEQNYIYHVMLKAAAFPHSKGQQ